MGGASIRGHTGLLEKVKPKTVKLNAPLETLDENILDS